MAEEGYWDRIRANSARQAESPDTSTQEALLAKAKAEPNWKPKGFGGNPQEFRQALAQSYLQSYAKQMEVAGSEDPDGDARDYRRGHVGATLEFAREQVGLRRVDPTWNMRPEEKRRWAQANPTLALEIDEEKNNPRVPITKFQTDRTARKLYNNSGHK